MREALLRPLMVLVGLALIGTIGYWVIEGWSPLESAYMVAITLSTVGYAEVQPVSTAGRVFTMGLIFFGISTGAYALGKLGETLVDGQLRGLARKRRMQKQIAEVADHILVCGFGRVGEQICEDLTDEEREFVIVEVDPTLEEPLIDKGYKHLIGDATDDDVLEEAGIARASVIAVCTNTDANNLFITLSARTLNERAKILAVARDNSSAPKLVRAGASRVVSPFQIAGHRMARMALRPSIIDFLDAMMHRSGGELALEEFEIVPGSRLDGRTLAEANLRRDLGISILGIVESGGNFSFNPAASVTLSAGQRLIGLGTREQLAGFAATLR